MARPQGDKPADKKARKPNKSKAANVAGADPTLPDDTGNNRQIPAVSEHPKARETSFKPGASGNPSGRPKGARSRLSEYFLCKLEDDFREHGMAAIIAMRTDKPSEYVRTVAAIVPKAFDLGDDEDENGNKVIGVALITRDAIEAIIERGRNAEDED